MTAPFAIGYWNGNRFVIPGLPQMATASAPAVPAITQQDVEAHQAATGLAGPQAPFGGPGGQAGGMERDTGFADPTRQGGVAPAPGQSDPRKGGINNWGSTLGTIGSLAGFAVPGFGGALLGPAANLAGSWIDARAANRGLMEQGLPGNVSALPAALSNGIFGLLGSLGAGRSIANQVGDIKNAAAAAMPAAAPFEKDNLGFLPGMTMGEDFSKDGIAAGGDGNGTSSGDGTKGGDSKSGDAWGGGTGGTSGWWAKGGEIPPPPAGAADPPGPDDQVGALQTGEGVLTRKAMKRFPGLLDALNKGDVKKARGLLG